MLSAGFLWCLTKPHTVFSLIHTRYNARLSKGHFPATCLICIPEPLLLTSRYRHRSNTLKVGVATLALHPQHLCVASPEQISIHSSHSSQATRFTAAPHMAQGSRTAFSAYYPYQFFKIPQGSILGPVQIIMSCLLGNALCFNECVVRTGKTQPSQQRLIIMYALQRNQSLLSLSSIVFKRILHWTQSN